MRYHILRRASGTEESSPSTLEADWLLRSGQDGANPQPGVVWFHDFRSDAEVNNFRWSGGVGVDPSGVGSSAARIRRITTDGMASGACLEALVGPGTAGQGSYWWRPLSPIVSPGNGKAANDPGDNGAIPARSWNQNNQNQLSIFNTGWYGHPTYANADPTHFDGTDFYLQVVCKMDPRRITGGNAANQSGKFIWITTAEGEQSLSNGEHVFLSHGPDGNQGAQNYLRAYVLGTRGPGGLNTGGPFGPLDDDAIAPGPRIQPGSSVAEDWYYSGGWDVLLFHVRLGTLNTISGANATLLEVWAAHQGETSYTKIWNLEFGNTAFQARNGLQAVILGGYNNNASFPQEFYHRYAQVIFKKSFIPCPQVWPSTAPWFESQLDKTWTQPATSFTTLTSVAQTPGTPAGICAWSGAAVGVFNDHQGLFVWGGGHADSLDNALFFYDLIDRRFYRIKDRSPQTGGDGSTQWGDGNPRVPHSYRHNVYTPPTATFPKGCFWSMCQMAGQLSGGSSDTVWRLNLATMVWTKVLTDWPGMLGDPFCECGALYSPSRALTYALMQYGGTWQFNPATNAMSQIADHIQPNPDGRGNAIALWDSVGLLLYRHPGGAFWTLNVANGAAGWTQRTVSGTWGASNGYPGLVWHQGSKKFLGWGHSSNRAHIHTLAPANPNATTYAEAISGTWQAVAVAPSASNTITPPDSLALDTAAQSGVFTRFNLIENLGGSGRDALILLNSSTTVPNVYKLPAGGLS